MVRPETTLFLLTSLDGKISIGFGNSFDFDTDFPKVSGLREGLYQYYAIEKNIDTWTCTSGSIQRKLGANSVVPPRISGVSAVVIDNEQLTLEGVQNVISAWDTCVFVTTNIEHPALSLEATSSFLPIYQEKLDIEAVLKSLYAIFECTAITIQTGSKLNALFLESGLIDKVDLVIAPCLIGGVATPSLIGGDTSYLSVFSLSDCVKLKHNYVRLCYSRREDVRTIEDRNLF